ncbi:MAG: DUF1833 family protein [Desulfuromonadales bacterium]|nr:DUF1833 family protein [Desulfuromonadales bacterium]
MTTRAQWKRFVSHVPEAQREYRTLEIWHPSLKQVYRFVKNYTDVTFGLESDAPRHAGSNVLFRGVTLEITEPAEREDSEQVLSVRFGNVDSTIHEILDQITGTGFFTEINIVYRKYYSGDLSQPAVAPLYLFAASIGFDGPASVSFSAEDADLSQKRSGILYTVEAFPGLRE